MENRDRESFTTRRKKWWLKRDSNKCQAPFEHICDNEHPLQVHHIKCHAYLKRVAPGVSADYPENAITLCRTAHEVIHPDVIWARQNYNRDPKTFELLRKRRSALMDAGKIYWVDSYDRMMEIVALVNTRKYEVKNPFPSYTRRKKYEIPTDSESENL